MTRTPASLIASWRGGDAAPLVRWLARAAHERNQFAQVDVAALAATLAARRGEADEERVIADVLSATTSAPGRRPAVTCGTYAATLQLDVLGLGDGEVVGPLLDVGCGPDAVLVRALRARGIDAAGVDRHIDTPAPFLVEADWTAAPLPPGHYATIVSHLALSLHLLHHHAAGAPHALELVRTWTALGAALASGGLLAYTPGLPMLERALDRSRFAVTRLPLPAELEAALAPLVAAVGEDVAYAAHVRRR